MQEGQGFEMWAGTSKDVTVTVTDASSGASVNLASGSVRWVLKTAIDSTACLLTKDSDWTGACAVTISGCTFSFTMPHADTDALAGTYYHEAEVKDSAGSTFKAMRGYITIQQGAI